MLTIMCRSDPLPLTRVILSLGIKYFLPQLYQPAE